MKAVKNWTGIFDAAQTDKQLGTSLVASDQQMAITYIEAVSAGGCTVNVSVMIGFAETTLPTITVNSSDGAPDFAMNHGAIKPGGGKVGGNGEGVIAMGAPGVHPLLTCSAPTGGDIRIIMAYILLDATVAV